ncbi:MAG: hypothetical protein LC733_12725, partial [Actinobacteria bacterium]|nr:hypothetical protein [Actinomycetota bacterium]
GPSGPLSGVPGPSGPLSGVVGRPPGPSGLVAASGSGAAAACGRQSGVPVWAVAGEGRVLPGELWTALAGRLTSRGRAWNEVEEIVPLDWVDQIVGPEGREAVAEGLTRPTCPPVPELLREVRR